MIEMSPIEKKRSRLLVKKGAEFMSLKTENIPLIYTVDKVVYVLDEFENKYICEQNLQELQAMLDERMFFRASRQCFININYFRSFRSVDHVKLIVKLNIEKEPFPIIVSKITAPRFKKWISEI